MILAATSVMENIKSHFTLHHYAYMQRHLLLFTILIALLNQPSAQKVIIPATRWSVEDGLPTNNITAIYEDSKGYLWVGTTEGLVRYNGASFEQFKPKNDAPPQLAEPYIIDIYEDCEANLWVLTKASGLYKVTLNRPDSGFSLIIPSKLFPKLINRSLTTPILHAQGTEAIIGYDDTIRIFKQGNERSTPWKSPCNHPIFFQNHPKIFKPIRYSCYQAIVVDVHKGILVISLKDGEIYYEVPQDILREIANTQGILRVNVLDNMFLVTRSNGNYWLFNWKECTLVSKGTLNLPDNIPLLKSGPLKDSGIIYTNLLSTFYYFNPLKNEWKNEKSSLYIRDSIYGLFKGMPESKRGGLYIISNYGLFKYNPHVDQLKLYKIDGPNNPYNSNSAIRSIIKTSNNQLYCLWDNTLYNYSEITNKFNSSLELENKTKNKSLPTLFLINGKIYIKQGALYSYNEITKKCSKINFIGSQAEFEYFEHSTINKHLIQNDSSIWFISTNGMLSNWNTQKQQLKVYKNNSNVQLKDKVVAFLEYDKEHMLIALLKGGLVLVKYVDPNTFKKLPYLQSLGIQDSLHLVTGVVKGHSGSIWVAVKGLGILHVSNVLNSNSHVTAYDVHSNLQNSNIKALQMDRNGNLWISTSTGVERFDTSNKLFKALHIPLVFPFNEFMDFSYCDSIGDIYFAGLSSFIQFNPINQNLNSSPPKIRLARWLINTEERPELLQSNNITLQSNERNISLYYHLLNLDKSSKYIFRYRITFNDKKPESWNYTDKQEIHLFNLSSGNYLVEYNAREVNGEWHSHDASLQFIIQEIWYKNIWVQLLGMMLIVSSIFLLYKNRLNQLRKLENLRNRISHDLHDDIGSTLASISIYSEVAKYNSQNERVDVLNKIGESSREMLENLNDIVWSINPKYDNTEDLINRIRNFGVQMLNPLNIEFELKTNLKNIHFSLDMEKRRNLFLIYKEALHNAVKYSKCTKVEVSILHFGGHMMMVISDNGIGFDEHQSKPVNGNGFQSMKQRAHTMNASLSIQSKPGYGTTISLKIP